MQELFEQYGYLFLLLGLVIMGDVVLIPAVYLVSTGVLGLLPVIAIMLLATLFSDTTLYLIGGRLCLQGGRIGRWLETRRQPVEHLSAVFKKHGLKCVFFSRFVYGTRTVIQLLSGAARLPYMKYILVNVMGVMAWMVFAVAVSLATHGSGLPGIQIVSDPDGGRLARCFCTDDKLVRASMDNKDA